MHRYVSEYRELIYNADVIDWRPFEENWDYELMPVKVRTWEEVGQIVDMKTLRYDFDIFDRSRHFWTSDSWSDSD